MTIDETIEQAYQDHAGAIRGKALQLTRDEELAADVTQEAFMRLFVEAQAGRMPDNIAAWLYRASANLIVSRSRRVAVAYRYAPRLVRDDEPARPEEVAVLHEDVDELGALLAGLAPSHRTALLMAAHGASGREIATRLGRSDMAVRTLLCRARVRLRTAASEQVPANAA